MQIDRSKADLRERAAQVAAMVGAFDVDGFVASLGAVAATEIVATGIGASEAPARLLAAELAALGVRVRFVPLSAFADGGGGSDGACLCIFSQGLSPNARLAVDATGGFASAFLFTSVAEGVSDLRMFVQAGGRVVTLPPSEESPSLLRIVGPPIAMLAALLFARVVVGERLPHDVITQLGPALAAARRRMQHGIADLPPLALDAPLAFVTRGGGSALALGLASKWLEGLGAREPAVWDVLEIAHGPFHAFHGGPQLLVALGAPSPLFDRLEQMLVSERHWLVRVEPTLPGLFARLEVEIAANELLLAMFDRRPRDLFSWPSKGKDAPLYGLSTPVVGSVARDTQPPAEPPSAVAPTKPRW